MWERGAEVAGVTTIAFVTTALAASEADLAGVASVVVSIGVAGVSGYFSARITTEQRIARLEAKLESMADEFRRYYQVRDHQDYSSRER